MNSFNHLIEKYWAGTISSAEKQELFEMLHHENVSFQDEDYLSFVKSINGKSKKENKSNSQYIKLYHEIETKLNEGKTISILNKKKWIWMAAASLILFSFGLSWFLFSSSGTVKKVAANVPVIKASVIETDANTIKDTVLTDGTIVKIYSNSRISFFEQFEAEKREIKMNGKVYFKVKKDSSRPFIVYAGGFTTRALGTQFEINTQKRNKFSVKLIEGKVVVKAENATARSVKDVYLTAGKTLLYDSTLQSVVVNEEKNKKIKSPEKIIHAEKNIANIPEISFTKLPLAAVFRQLETEYNIMIIYDPDKIDGKELSGSFKKTKDPVSLLKSIADKFDLKVGIEYGAYKID